MRTTLALTASMPMRRPVLVVGGVGQVSQIAPMSDVEHDGDVGALEKMIKGRRGSRK